MIFWQTISIFNCKKMELAMEKKCHLDYPIIGFQLPSSNVYLLALPERVESHKTLVHEST